MFDSTTSLFNYFDNLKGKLNKKNLDMIIANDVSNPSIGFNSEQNEVYVITENEQIKLEQQSKNQLSGKIVNLIIQHV
mgnify:CR=1 FL=1